MRLNPARNVRAMTLSGRVLLGLGALLVSAVVAVPEAHGAAGAYYSIDDFSASPTDWSVSRTTNADAVFIATSQAHSPSRIAELLIPYSATTADGVYIDKLFYEPGSAPPNGGTYQTPIGCKAYIWARAIIRAQGQLQMIDYFTGNIIGSKSFTASPSGWTQIVVTNSTACSPWIDVRIAMSGTGSAQTLMLDDLTVQWSYN